MRGRGYRSFAVVAVAAVAVAAGCTMCPDPHDYSGPVPNGSAPQNDFRARSHGIIPTGATVRPWPAVVKTAPPNSPARPPAVAPVADEEPLVAEADGTAGEDADVIQLSAAVAAEEESPPAEAVDPVDTDAVAAALVDPADATIPATEAEADARQEGDRQESARPQATERPPVVLEPGLRETPGWRPRR